MSLYDLIISRRSIRQFKPNLLPRELLEKLVNAARLAPSAANLQPLEYIVVDEEKARKQLHTCLKWAAYISPQGDPKSGHEPAAYIVVIVCSDIRDKGYERDVGGAMENMILAAWEDGVGSCWLVSVEREKIRKILDIPEEYKIDSVLALGYPDEKPQAEDMKESIKYWKDKKEQLHVPKRKLRDMLHFNKF